MKQPSCDKRVSCISVSLWGYGLKLADPHLVIQRGRRGHPSPRSTVFQSYALNTVRLFEARSSSYYLTRVCSIYSSQR